ncbi:MAG TPA: DUF1573 domain-containing protein [Flavipsychrobacter sp.]|nr:DUF1573 domain-containing protein [Flavipsychrobacter sp.]
MNAQLKTVLLTVLTLSVFTIALVELSGVSSTALYNKYKIGNGGAHSHDPELSEVQRKENEAKAMPKTKIEFAEMRHNFGTITEGEKVKHAFKFKNTGDQPLLVYNVVAGCGCTTPSWSKDLVMPGQEGEIQVEFNSENRPGQQSKNVLVYSNGQDESISIGFDVFVEKK